MKKILLALLGVILICSLVLTVWTVRALSSLPDVSALKNYRPSAAIEVLDKDGNLITHMYDRKLRIWASINSLPDVLIDAVVTAEDDTFFEHHGVNYKATKEAMLHDVQKRRFARGGSTITQQMIKNVLLSKEKTISRKLKEYVLARRVEEVLTKHRILEIYLNEVEWGDTVYGVEAASRFYFDKTASGLTPAEAALLAGMLPNPRYFNPYKRPEKARKRQEQVLFNMQQAKLLSQEEYAAALQEPLRLRKESDSRMEITSRSAGNARPCYLAVMEEVLVGILGEQRVYRGGGSVTTTLEQSLQNELKQWESSLQNRPAKPPKEVLVVLLEDRIRALSCSDDSQTEIQSRLEAAGWAARGYTARTVPLQSITREQFVQATGVKQR